MLGQVLLALSAFPDAETANHIAHTLVAEKFAACANKLRSLHPYELPEIIYVKIDKGLPGYLRWVAEGCAS